MTAGCTGGLLSFTGFQWPLTSTVQLPIAHQTSVSLLSLGTRGLCWTNSALHFILDRFFNLSKPSQILLPGLLNTKAGFVSQGCLEEGGAIRALKFIQT